MKSILFLLFIFFSGHLFAVDTVRMTNPGDLQITGTTNGTATGTYTLGSVNPTDGIGATDATAAIVYVPVSNTLAANQPHDTYFALYHAGYSLFNIADTTYSYLTFPLTLNITSAQYLYGAVYNGTNYIVVRKSAPGSFSSQTDTIFQILLNDIAAVICPVNNALCTSLDISSPNLAQGVIAKLYFFISTNASKADGDTVDLASTTDGGGGVYFQVNLSNKIYTQADISITLTTPLTKGDGRVIANYIISNPITTAVFDHVAVFLHAKASSAGAIPAGPAANLPVGDPSLYSGYPDAKLIDQNFSSAETDTSITINSLGEGQPLVNGTSYLLSIGLMDKYQFVTGLSNAGVGTPLKIQELLNKQACFLLTAGFGEEHYVISFFRQYRDLVLANTWAGKKFIGFYYRLAPHYALIIYQNEWMRLVIRSGAYALYFFFNYYWCFLVLLGFFLFFNFKNGQKKQNEKKVRI